MSYIFLFIIIIFLIPGPGLCKENGREEPHLDISCQMEPPGKFYKISVEYISAYRNEDNSEYLGLEDDDVQVQLLPIVKEQFKLIIPGNWQELGPKFKPEFSWSVELKPEVNDPIMVIKWEVMNRELSGRAKVGGYEDLQVNENLEKSIGIRGDA